MEHRARRMIFLVIAVGPAFFSDLRPLTSDLRLLSLDYSVRSRQHIRRNRQADLLGGLEIDHQLKLRRRFNRQVSRLRSFEDFIHVSGGAAVLKVEV